MNVMFDTLAYVQEMEAVGFTRAQAEALARNQAKLIDERLATKLDLKALENDLSVRIEQLRTELKRDIEQLRTELKRDIEQLRTDVTHEIKASELRMTIKLGTIVTAVVALFAAITHFWH